MSSLKHDVEMFQSMNRPDWLVAIIGVVLLFALFIGINMLGGIIFQAGLTFLFWSVPIASGLATAVLTMHRAKKGKMLISEAIWVPIIVACLVGIVSWLAYDYAVTL